MSRNPVLVLTLSAVLMWGILPSWGGHASAIDLEVQKLEITQAIQDTTNSIELIAGRSTAVRAFVVDKDSGTPTISGTLKVFIAGASITATPGLPAINQPLTLPSSPPSRSNENDTLNFHIVEPTVLNLQPPSGAVSANVTFRVDVEAPGSSDFLEVTLPIRKIVNPRVYFQRIAYPPQSLGPPDIMTVKHPIGDAMMRGVFPVEDSDPFLYVSVPTILSFNTDLCWPGEIDKDIGATSGCTAFYTNCCGASCGPGQPNDVDELFADLEASLSLIVDGGFGFKASSFLYGWLPDSPLDIFPCRGWAKVCNHVGFGNTSPVRYQRTFAHELGHMFSMLPHNSRMLMNEGWDVGGRLVDTCVSMGLLKPTSFYDFMAAAKTTCEAWVDTQTYGYFLANGFFCTGSSTTAPDDGPGSTHVLFIQGSFSSDGTQLADLKPVFRFPWLSHSTSSEQSGPYLAEITDENGGVTTREFDALQGGPEADDEENADPIRGHFAVRVPLGENLRATLLRIVDSADPTVEFGRIEGALSPPVLTVDLPNSGDLLSGEVTVEWTADPGGADLLYQVAYSHDGGQSFVPVGVNLTETTVTFDTSDVPSSAGEGLIRVFVSNGLDTTFEDVDQLTITDGVAISSTPVFVRGDVNLDGTVMISDAVMILNHLFAATPPTLACEKAADLDDCGNINISDAVYTLFFLFSGGPAPQSPYPSCGPDPSLDSLSCVSSPPCP